MRTSTLLAATIAGLLVPLAHAASVDDVLAKMDRSAAKFKTMTADFSRIEYTAVIKDTSEDTGKIYLLRRNFKDVRFRIDFTKPEQKSVEYANRKMNIYLPKANTVQEYDFGKQGKIVDEYLMLLLGFGTPGSELKKSYDVKYVGDGSKSARNAVHLELTPRSKDAQQRLKMLDLWVDAAEAYPLEQKVVLPSGDYKTFRYSNIEINPPLREEQVRLTLPKDVHREYPQKN